MTTAAHGAHLHAVADPNGMQTGFMTGFQDTGRVHTGIVVDGTAIANCYRVHLDGGHCPVFAASMSHTSQSCLGATEINSYAPGTRVAVMYQAKDNKAVIIGSFTDGLDIGKRAFHDYVSQAARNRVDDCHKKYIKQDKAGSIVDYSNWRPYDGTLASEWGAIATTGLGVTLDDFMVRLSVNEFTGVYGFYHDNLLRVAGYNMQTWTAGSERDAYMDQAECNDYQGYTPYPWEGVGILQPGIRVIEQYDAGCYHCFKEKPYYSRWENKYEWAQPYHRTQTFYGYIGQGGRRSVTAPPQGEIKWTYEPNPGGEPPPPFDSAIESSKGFSNGCVGGPSKDKSPDSMQPMYGLCEDNRALDGRIFMASAKGVTIAKRVLLPMPKRLKRPEDPQGDEAKKNYKAASMFGSGPDHPITGTLRTTDTTYPNMQRAATVMDLHAYLYNYSGFHAFYWHAKDYKLWEEQELKYADVLQKIPEFSRLATEKMYLKEEEPKFFEIDHRYKKSGPQKFYETTCHLSLLEDGGVVIGDGYGAEIRMSGGVVIISAPGDVWLKGGRDVQAWAGNDVIARANKTVDISATEKNVRIKAERHVLVLSGNDGKMGGILLESRGATKEFDFEKCGEQIKFSGVVARAPKSQVVGLARDIYLRTGGGEVEEGDITLDATKGRKNILTKSANIYSFVTRSVFHFFGNPQGEDSWTTDKSNYFDADFTLLCGPIGTDADIVIDGNVLARGSTLCSRGHIFTEVAARGFIFVAPCDGKCQADVDAAVEAVRQAINETLPQAGDKVHSGIIEPNWYKEKRAGNSRVMTIMEFSFRTNDDYKITDFLLYEDRWAQWARIGGQQPKKWTERPVKVKVCGETYPFPGEKWLVSEPAYREEDFSMVVFEKGGLIDLRRGKAPGLAGPYRDPQYGKGLPPKVINGNYPIIPRPS